MRQLKDELFNTEKSREQTGVNKGSSDGQTFV